MTLDFICLYLQIFILIGIISREYFRNSGRNLIAIIFCGAFLVLVSGQDWWMLSIFSDNDLGEMTHLNQVVSLQGAKLANIYTGLSVFSYLIAYWYFDKSKKIKFNIEIKSTKNANPPYIILYIWVLIMILSLINSAGGITQSLVNPGLNQAYGVTMLLIFLSIGKFPLMEKIVNCGYININDIILFTFVFIFFLLNARLNTGLLILQLIILINYCRNELSRKLLMMVPFSIFMVFIVFGLYREYASHANGDIDISLLFDFFINYYDASAVLNWFYSSNIEGFSGLAGILTFENEVGVISHDFGLSNLSFLFQFIPGAIRTDPDLPFLEMSQFFLTLYPYRQGSFIPPGLEMSYANFGLLGVIAFGFLLGYLTQKTHLAMLNSKSNQLLTALLSVQLLHAIRGPFSNVIYYSIADCVMLAFYFLIKSALQKNNIKILSKGH